MRLFLGENVDKLLVVSNAPTSQKLEQLIVTVTSMNNLDNVISLWPRDALDNSKLGDKRHISVNTIQQLNTIDSQLAHMSFVQWTNVTELR